MNERVWICEDLGDREFPDGEWVDCWKCGGEGTTGHDCGEDCCCCLEPEDNVICDECGGAGGWHADPTTEPRE